MSVVLLTNELYADGMELLKKESGVETVVTDQSDPGRFMSEFVRAGGLILRIGRVTREMIEQAPDLKVITRPGVGVDTIDVEAATEFGIPVVVTPGANVRSVAEHTLAMLFALSKNLFESYAQTKAGNFFIRNKYAAFELNGKTLGVLGFGNIGREVARLAAPLGMDILVFDPFVERSAVEALGYRKCGSPEELLPLCDAVTLHMPATPDTVNLIDGKRLALCKPSAVLVNCARGTLVDEAALYEALSSGKLAGAGEDMMAVEPMDPESPLFKLPNFIASPHMAALTRESAARSAVMAVQGTLAVIRGERWPYVSNPKAYENPRWN